MDNGGPAPLAIGIEDYAAFHRGIYAVGLIGNTCRRRRRGMNPPAESEKAR
jgi:hypothetical protein